MWSHFRVITIDNPPSVDGYQAKLTIPLLNGMNPDFSDIRFTTPSGQTVPYWIAESSPIETAVWLRLPVECSELIMHYGNPDVVSESNGEAVFDFYDGFDGTVSGQWSHYVSGGTDTFENGILKTGVSSGSLMKRWNWYVKTLPTMAPFEYIVRYKTSGEITGRNMSQSHFGLMSSNTNMQYSSFSPILWQIYGLSENTWHTISFSMFTDGRVYKKIDGVESLVTSSNNDFDVYPFFGTQLWDYYWHYIYVDYVIIRKRLSIEPTLTLGDPIPSRIRAKNSVVFGSDSMMII